MRCDIVIPVWNELEATKGCVDSILKYTDYPFRLIIIDNGSEDSTRSYLDGLTSEKRMSLTLVRNGANLGFVVASNQGLRLSDAPYVCLMNNDTAPADGWLGEMIRIIDSDRAIGMVNPSSNTSGQSPSKGQSIDDYASTLKRFKGQRQELFNCRGFCMLLKREVIEKVGFLDEVYGIGYFEETDYCRRAHELGYTAVRAKASYVYHKERATFDRLKDAGELFRKNEEIFLKKWGRPVGVAYLVDELSEGQRVDGIALAVARLGHRVSIFLKRGLSWPVSVDHFDIRRFDVGSLFFAFVSAYKIFRRRRKKPLEIVITDNGRIGTFLKLLRPLHGADIAIGACDREIKALLDRKSRSR